MLLLGVLAAQAEGAVAAAGSYDLLETEILTGSQASVTFSSLNSTYGADYQHLQLRMAVRTDRADTGDALRINFNGVTTSSYAWHYLLGTGSVVLSGSGTSQTHILGGATTASTNIANTFAGDVMDILDPFETTKNTTIRSLSGHAATTQQIRLASGFYNSTDAIDSITLDQNAGSNFLTGCRFSLYGLKASA